MHQLPLIEGTPIKDDTYIYMFLHSPTAWAATVCLWGFNLVCTVSVCDHISCEAHSFPLRHMIWDF